MQKTGWDIKQFRLKLNLVLVFFPHGVRPCNHGEELLISMQMDSLLAGIRLDRRNPECHSIYIHTVQELKSKTRQKQKVTYIIRPGNAGVCVCVCERERDGGWFRGINPRRQFEGKVEFQFKM